HQRLNLLRADREFLDEHDGLAAAEPQPFADHLAIALVAAIIAQYLEILDVALHQRLKSAQVVRHSLEDLVLLEVLSLRDLDSAVERKIAGMNTLEGFH